MKQKQNGNHNGKLLRSDLVRQADDTRNKLARTVERIDQRRHQALDVRRQVEKHLKQLAIAAGLVVVGTAGLAAFLTHRLLTGGQRRRRARWQLARTVWRDPERRLRAQRGPFLGEVLRSVAFTAATTLLAVPIRRALQKPR
jgi:hypothetical protein